MINLVMEYEYDPGEADGAPATVTYHRVLGIDSHEISPEDYLALKEALRLADRSVKGEVILRREEG